MLVYASQLSFSSWGGIQVSLLPMCSRSYPSQLGLPSWRAERSSPLGPVDRVTSNPVGGGAGVGSGFKGFEVVCQGHSAGWFSG